MPRKHASKDFVTEKEILAIYHKILPLVYHNPDHFNLVDEINKRLRRIVRYAFFHCVMEDPDRGLPMTKFVLRFETWENFTPGERIRNVTLGLESKGDPFESDLQRSYERAVELAIPVHPRFREFHYYRMRSNDYPRIAIGFFRLKREDNAFTRREKELFQRLKHDIFLLFRTVYSAVYHTQIYQHFQNFATISTRVAAEFQFSNMEVKLLPDILSGHSIEETAAKHFISPATVKTHINHILKKTGTKNRMEFITRFFTSPENVPL